MKVLYRSDDAALLAISGQRPFMIFQERYTAIQLNPPFDNFPTTHEVKLERGRSCRALQPGKQSIFSRNDRVRGALAASKKQQAGDRTDACPVQVASLF